MVCSTLALIVALTGLPVPSLPSPYLLGAASNSGLSNASVVQAIPPPPGWGPGGRYRPSPSYTAAPRSSASRLRIGGYGGARLRLGLIGSSFGLFLGGGGGVLLGPVFIGGAGYLLAEHTGNFGGPAQRRYRLDLGYGGLEVGGSLLSRRFFDLGLRTLVGVGTACLRSGTLADDCLDRTGYIAIDPEFFTNFYVNDFFRLGVGAGYRLALTQSWMGPGVGGLSGPFIGFGADFGRF